MPAPTPVVVCGEAAEAPAATIVLFGELTHASFCWEYPPSAAATRGADVRCVPGWLGASTRPLQKYAEVIQRVCMRGVWRCMFSVWYALRVALFSISHVRLASLACTHVSKMYKGKTSGAIVLGTAPAADVMLGRCLRVRVRTKSKRARSRERRQTTTPC
jgi:hypothetical protein